MGRPPKRIRVAEHRDDDLILKTSRHANDMRLKSKFESIFAKYSQDFTQVGDEIDLETGRIVVDNGHVAGMRDEQDVGRGDAQRFLRALASTENEATGFILDSPSVGIDNHQDEARPLDPRKLGSTPIANASGRISAGQPQQSSQESTMLQELSQNIASILLPYVAGLGRTSQATEPAWRTPDIGLALPTDLPNTAARTPAINCMRVSPEKDSLWAVPGRRASARHTRATTGQLEWRGRILDDDSEIDELSPVGNVSYNRSRNVKHACEKKRSFPPFSREEDQRLIKMKEGSEFDKPAHWKDISERFPGRPIWALIYRYNKHLKAGAVESSPVLPETSSIIRSHADGGAPGDMLPSPVSMESLSVDRRTLTSQAATPHEAAYVSRHKDEQPASVVAKRAGPRRAATLPEPRLLRSRTGGGKSSVNRWGSLLDNTKAPVRDTKGPSTVAPIVIPNSDSLDGDAVQLSQTAVSQGSSRIQATPTSSSRTCKVVIPSPHQHDTIAAEPRSQTSRPERSIKPSKTNKPALHSRSPARCLTPTREDNSPKSTRQHAIRFRKGKRSSVHNRATGTPNSSRRPLSKLTLSPESEDELAL